jgi:hypothetical protein
LVEEKRSDESDASTYIAYDAPKDQSYLLVLAESSHLLEELEDDILAGWFVGILLREETLSGIACYNTHSVKFNLY